MARGGKRKDSIERADRPCPVHGVTEHAKYTSNGLAHWRCMECAKEAARHQDNSMRGTRPWKKEEPLQFCPNCHMALPKTGICDEC